MQRSFLIAGLLAFAVLTHAQQPVGPRITPNFKDADITSIAESVSSVTGKNFIIDPRVRAQVTVLSSTPLSPDAFYELFLSILQVHGFAALPAGNAIKIIPDANARQLPSNDLSDRVSSTSDEFVTQVVAVKSVNAAQLVPILRPLMATSGQMAAYPASNILILSDRAANVSRLMKIINRIDREGDATVEVIPLQNASAAEITRIITGLYQQQAAEGGATSFKLVADDRSNSVLISGDQAQRLRIKTLIAHLDTPLDNGGDTQVRYLKFADAEKIAPKLKEQVTGIAQAAAGGGAAAAAGPAAQADKGTTIWADPETNALIITAPPKTMHSLMEIVNKLDIRRMQVQVEAIIVEVSQDKTAELGVNWAAFSNENDTRVPAGGFLTPVGGVSLIDLAKGIDNPANAPSGLANGTTIGIGKVVANGVNFGAMLRAIRGDSDSNVLATPSTVTMDNQEAILKVAQQVPFITGSFTNTGAAGGSTNPFQTVQREEVGTILKVTPQIAAEGNNFVQMKISVESSSVASNSVSTVDITTNKRTIDTNVLIEDGGIIVLGGLISSQSDKGEQRVPFLGRIPLIGLAFKTRSAKANKTNLMIFIRPKILRDDEQSAIETGAKYNYMRDLQRKANGREMLPMLPGVPKPELPKLPPPAKEAAPAPEKPKAAEPPSTTQPADNPSASPAPAETPK